MRRVSPGILLLISLVACGRTPEPGGDKPSPSPSPRSAASAAAPGAAAPRAEPGREEQPKVIPVDAPRTREDLQRLDQFVGLSPVDISPEYQPDGRLTADLAGVDDGRANRLVRELSQAGLKPMSAPIAGGARVAVSAGP